jgi:mono/diheme cytochrome c family protein
MRTMSSLIFVSLFAMACGGKSDRVDEINELEGDPENGAVVYAANCAGCHGADGTGGSGPDITGEDDQDEVTEVVLSGEDSMPAFDGDLSDQEIADVVAFVIDGL